eukprot:CAMPEP_0203752488 /NCGR_PEP_ID=MMETSP0098-20131031/6412_1 /ASSEMBLY_ACC=CAM_ASM_000208 /TAXON_ID=96639 /ORGANISM=" , Strain NY0313808BC1" /LENGTH=377 /DNA_ID=CAMNT_0050642689 /DNA_START=298 /DNA_END=1428 /DNA_ORIENTATION=+
MESSIARLVVIWYSIVVCTGKFEDCGSDLEITAPNELYVLPNTQFKTNARCQGACKVCFQILSIQYDAHEPSCLTIDEARVVNVQNIPYGKHYLFAWIQRQGGQCKGSQQLVPFLVTPVLPTSVPQGTCHKKVTMPKKSNSLAIISVVNRGKESFKKALDSWHKSGLLDLASETIIFLQNNVENDPRHAYASLYGVKVVGEPMQIGLSSAMNVLFEMVHTEQHILFLEEDFIIKEQYWNTYTKTVVSEAQSLLHDGLADVVQLRHRRHPGIPFFSWSWIGHEQELLTMETPYNSNHSLLDTLHWLYHPPSYFKDSNLIWDCSRHAHDWFCAFSTHAAWSNNPFLTTKAFYDKHIRDVAATDWRKDIEGAINNSPHLW